MEQADCFLTVEDDSNGSDHGEGCSGSAAQPDVLELPLHLTEKGNGANVYFCLLSSCFLWECKEKTQQTFQKKKIFISGDAMINLLQLEVSA